MPHFHTRRRAALVLIAVGAALTGRAEPDAPSAKPLRSDLALELFAREPDIATPIAIAVDPRGRVLAIESNTHFQKPGYRRHPTDRVLVIEDADRDGAADRFGVFADGFQQAMALALAGAGRVYLATRRDVLLLGDADGDGRCDEKTYLARLQTLEQYPHNGLSGFAFDGRGNLHFAIGENMGVGYSLVGADGAVVTGGPEGGSIFRMRADGSGLVRWATGFWNTFHLAFDPHGRLFAVDNDPDSRPPCRLLHIVRGGDYGYRRWLGRKGLHPFTAWNGELPGTLPMVSGTGEAPSGLVWYQGTGLPEDLRGGFLVTSWGDYRVERHRPEPRGASFRSHPEPLVAGGEDFRPVGIAIAPDGSVYFTDWVDKDYNVHGKGRIWRLRGLPAQDAPSGSGAPGAARGGATMEGAAAVRLLAESGSLSEERLLRLLESPDPETRLEAIVGFRPSSRPAPEVLLALERFLGDPDPFLLAAAVDALGRLAPLEHLLARRGAGEPRQRLGVLLALRRTGEPAAREALAGFLADPDPEVRRAALHWAGEERIAGTRGQIELALSRGPVTRPIFDAYLAAASLLGGESPERRDGVSRDEALLAMARDRARPAELRARALRSVSPGLAGLDLKLLGGFLDEKHPALRLEALRSLRDGAPPGARDALEALARDGRGDPALRREAVAALSRFFPETRDALEALRRAAEPRLGTEAARALRLSVPPAASGAQIGDAERSKLLEGGDPAEGELLFFYPRGPRCASCHCVRGRGGVAGPDLSAAGHTPRSRHLESILAPSKEIAPQYATWAITTRDGVKVGTIAGEDDHGALLLAGAEGQLDLVPHAVVRSRAMVEASLMPEGLAAALTLDELRDLLAFLESLTP